MPKYISDVGPLSARLSGASADEPRRLFHQHLARANHRCADSGESPALTAIASAGLDVLVNEPGRRDDPIFELENAIVTPQAAIYLEGAIKVLQHKATEQVAQALRGKPSTCLINLNVIHHANLRRAPSAGADQGDVR